MGSGLRWWRKAAAQEDATALAVLQRMGGQAARWRLVGYDTFADEYYDIAGDYATREEAEAAMRAAEAKLAGQPGSPGLRDQVIVLPASEPTPGPRHP